MARIKSGDTGDELVATDSWLQRLLGMFNVKPVFAGAFGTAVCAFMISGVISSEPSGAAVASGTGEGVVADPITPEGTTPIAFGGTTSSNSVASGGSLFDQFQQVHATTVSDRFYLPSGN